MHFEGDPSIWGWAGSRNRLRERSLEATQGVIFEQIAVQEQLGAVELNGEGGGFGYLP